MVGTILSFYHLLPEPERLTELYFEDHTGLPAKYLTGETQSFRFTVHNLEYAPMAYPYTVSLKNAAGETELAGGTLSLPQDGRATVPVTFTLSPPATRSAVFVMLTDKNQSIHFWMDPPASAIP